MIVIISVTEKGNSIGRQIQSSIGGDLFESFDVKERTLKEITREAFDKYKGIVFISSTGIAVRSIAEFLKGKDKDPAVVVVDVCSKFSISLVSGHLGGANELTLEISKVLSNTAVITTATDNLDIMAPDVIAKNNNLIIDSLKECKELASSIVNGKKVFFLDERKLIPCPKGYEITDTLQENTLWITDKDKEVPTVTKLIRKDLVLGIGCRRGTKKEKIYSLIEEVMQKNNLSLKAIKNISSIDVKSNEEGLLEVAKDLQVPLSFFSRDEIKIVEDKYIGSEFVKNTVGVKAVCEPVIELSSAEIIINKIKRDGITLAIGRVI